MRFFRFLFIIAWLLVPPALAAGGDAGLVGNLKILSEARFQTPDRWQWRYFNNHDGARIRYGFVHVPNCKGTIVLVPGFNDTGETYFETIRDFVAHGFDVWQMDWRGQGGSQRYFSEHEKCHSLGTDHDEADLTQFISLVRKAHLQKPLVLVGHSFGGLVTLRYLHDQPGTVDMAVLGAPALSLVLSDNPPTWMSRLVIGTMVLLGYGQSYASGQSDWYHMRSKLIKPELESHDPERVYLLTAWYDKNPELRAAGATWGFANEFQKTGLLVTQPKYLKDIRTPILIGSALADKIADPDVHKEVCLYLPHAKLITIPEARHCIFHESDEYRKTWMEAIYKFIEHN
jgi:lysophospholipase